MHITVTAESGWQVGDVLFRIGHSGDWAKGKPPEGRVLELHFARVAEIRLGIPNPNADPTADDTLIPTAYLKPIMEEPNGDGNDVHDEPENPEPS